LIVYTPVYDRREVKVLGIKKGRGRRHATPEEALEALREQRRGYEKSRKGKARHRRYVAAHREQINRYRRDLRKRKRASLRAAV